MIVSDGTNCGFLSLVLLLVGAALTPDARPAPKMEYLLLIAAISSVGVAIGQAFGQLDASIRLAAMTPPPPRLAPRAAPRHRASKGRGASPPPLPAAGGGASPRRGGGGRRGGGVAGQRQDRRQAVHEADQVARGGGGTFGFPGDRARTGDIQLGRLALYQLSYARARGLA